MKTLIIAYLTLGAVILIEHRLFAYRWRHYELGRRTLGIATVLFWALLLAIHGIINLYSWTIIAIAFGIAGALIGALYTNEAARQREAKLKFQRYLIERLDADADQQHPTRILREHDS